MARPIEATPILKNDDALRLLEQMKRNSTISTAKREELMKCRALYLKSLSQKATLSPKK